MIQVLVALPPRQGLVSEEKHSQKLVLLNNLLCDDTLKIIVWGSGWSLMLECMLGVSEALSLIPGLAKMFSS